LSAHFARPAGCWRGASHRQQGLTQLATVASLLVMVVVVVVVVAIGCGRGAWGCACGLPNARPPLLAGATTTFVPLGLREERARGPRREAHASATGGRLRIEQSGPVGHERALSEGPTKRQDSAWLRHTGPKRGARRLVPAHTQRKGPAMESRRNQRGPSV